MSNSQVASTPKLGPRASLRLVTLDPGHFHAALVQKEMYPGVARRAFVYAPLGPDLLAHLNRIAQFNARKENPTNWELEIYVGPDFLERMVKDRRGNVVVLSGRNRGKIDRILASIDAGFHVLADKPWIIEAADMPKLEAALAAAERRGVVAYDIMTERFEITSILQRELVRDADTFGTMQPGSQEDPGVYIESVHHLFKEVAGAPLLRPAWFFDIHQQGEGLTDVGTHLVDLAEWTLFPEGAINNRRDIKVTGGKRWPVVMTKAEFQRVTGEREFPEYLAAGGDRLDYYCNNQVSYVLRGVHVKLDVLWRYEAPTGTGDTHLAIYRGSRSRVEVRQGKAENYRPELYVAPNDGRDKAGVLAALKHRVEALKAKFPGVAVEDRGKEMLVPIPDRYRVGHEAHFAQVARQFFGYLRDPKSLPAWENPGMLAKYYVTTRGVGLARKASV